MEKVKILTSALIFADVGTKITIVENILHAFSLDKTEPHRLPMHAPPCLPTSSLVEP